MSDADYTAFLDKANQNTGGAAAQQEGTKYGTKSVNTAIPKVLEEVEEYFTSDADEPFEPVSLSYKGDEEISAGETVFFSHVVEARDGNGLLYGRNPRLGDEKLFPQGKLGR